MRSLKSTNLRRDRDLERGLRSRHESNPRSTAMRHPLSATEIPSRRRCLHTLFSALVTMLVTCAGGCSSPAEVVTPTGPRPPLRADQVSIYEKEPSRYELHGAVTVTRE